MKSTVTLRKYGSTNFFKSLYFRNRIRADCLNCGPENLENAAQKENQKNDCFAVFRFKCVKCSELCAALSHIRPNWEQAECGICLDEPSDVGNFPISIFKYSFFI